MAENIVCGLSDSLHLVFYVQHEYGFNVLILVPQVLFFMTSQKIEK